MSNPNIELAISYYEALNRRDFDAYNILFADDVTFGDPRCCLCAAVSR